VDAERTTPGEAAHAILASLALPVATADTVSQPPV
jgi:hypothetical protein